MHTKEPWHVRTLDGSMGCIDDKDDYSIAYTQQRPHDMLHKERIANSRRIVACVNACAGIETSILESEAITGYNHPWQLMNKALKKAESERDELLAAIKKYANNYLLDEKDEPELCMNDEHHEDVLAVFKAIAKAEGL